MDRITQHSIPGLDQGKTYLVGRSHHDVNGMWGGHRSWIVHYADEETNKDNLIVYVAIGNYWNIGHGMWEGIDSQYSRFNVIEHVINLMESGVSPDLIYNAVKVAVVKLSIEECRMDRMTEEIKARECCFIPDQSKLDAGCQRLAEYQIWTGYTPDDYTESCAEHLEEMLDDSSRFEIVRI